MALVIAGAFSHLHRVKLIAGRWTTTPSTTGRSGWSRSRSRPARPSTCWTPRCASLPGIEQVDSARDSLQVRAKIARPRTYGEHPLRRWNPLLWFGQPRNQMLATVTPAGDSGRVTLICEPENPAWSDWFLVDDGTNYENAEAIVRAITRRVGDRRRGEQASATQTAEQKELTEAKLHLLHAQVGTALPLQHAGQRAAAHPQRPARAEAMLGHLIQYLRRSLPSAEEEMSTLGAEPERALAYLEILKIRMGDRLRCRWTSPSRCAPPRCRR